MRVSRFTGSSEAKVADDATNFTAAAAARRAARARSREASELSVSKAARRVSHSVIYIMSPLTYCLLSEGLQLGAYVLGRTGE